MVMDKKGTETDPGPYWVTKQPWIKDRETLIDNRAAVLGVMNSTMRKLSKNPKWREIYKRQLLDLLERGFAREVSEKGFADWMSSGRKIYYISHQMVVNPSSKSTPVRVVYNSSLSWKGQSLNTSWSEGPIC